MEALMIRRRVSRNVRVKRLKLIGDVLKLRKSEVRRAASTDKALIEFAEKHNQSLDWILRDNPRLMILALKEMRSSRLRQMKPYL
jgi:hypothetical protein